MDAERHWATAEEEHQGQTRKLKARKVKTRLLKTRRLKTGSVSLYRLTASLTKESETIETRMGLSAS